MPARETHLFADPVTPRRRFWRVQRWGVVTAALLLGMAALVVGGLVSLVGAVLDRNERRDTLKDWAVDAMPLQALAVTSGFNGINNAYAIGDVALTPTEVVSLFGPRWGDGRWFEIPDTATPTSRAYLSRGQDRILEVTATRCLKTRQACPPSGATVTIQVSVGGPKS